MDRDLLERLQRSMITWSKWEGKRDRRVSPWLGGLGLDDAACEGTGCAASIDD
jgi:hypothetical protein